MNSDHMLDMARSAIPYGLQLTLHIPLEDLCERSVKSLFEFVGVGRGRKPRIHWLVTVVSSNRW